MKFAHCSFTNMIQTEGPFEFESMAVLPAL